MDAFDELQIAVVAHGERMADFLAWADELQIQYRALSARVQALEQCVAKPADENDIEARLARFKRMSSINDVASSSAE